MVIASKACFIAFGESLLKTTTLEVTLVPVLFEASLVLTRMMVQ
jgi:hypothetical protein